MDLVDPDPDSDPDSQHCKHKYETTYRKKNCPAVKYFYLLLIKMEEIFLVIHMYRVSDHFNTDPEQAFRFDADLDPDPVPDPL